MYIKHDKGFTVIELMIVIVLIGIAATIVIAALSRAKGQGTFSKAQSQVGSIRRGAELYYYNNGNTYGGTFGNCTSGMFADSSRENGNIKGYFDDMPAGVTLDCGVTGDLYSVAFSHSGPDGTDFWCIDSKGAARDTTESGVKYTALVGGPTAAHVLSGAVLCQ